MPDDLSSIEGLADKHRRILARQHVTDLRGLVQADRRVIHRAMANLRPRPALELISRWQEDARSKLDEVVTDASQWHTAASFVIIFGQRQQEGAWERRVEAERTEVEPELRPQRWDGWDCAPLCAWMTSQLGQLGQPASSTEPEHRSLAGSLSLAECPSPSSAVAGPPSAGAARPTEASRPPRPRHPIMPGRPPGRLRAAAEHRPSPASHRQRRAHRRGRPYGRGDERPARFGPAHRIHRASPRGPNRQRWRPGNATASGHPHPAPARPRLEPQGPGDPVGRRPGRVRPVRGTRGRAPAIPDRLGPRRLGQARLGPPAPGHDPRRLGAGWCGNAPGTIRA